VSEPLRESQFAPFLLTLILCLAWLAPGLVGHDPWKGDEAETMGLVHSILSGAPAWLPTLAGQASTSAAPPLYPIVAALFAQWLSPFFPAHDGARLAGGAFILLTLVFASLTGRELYGRKHGRLVVLTLVGSIGLWLSAHESIPQSAMLCGVSMFGYGVATSTRRAYLGGAIAGTGLGITFMSSGLVETVALIATLLALPLFSPVWRRIAALQSVFTTIIAAAPWLVLWPWHAMHATPDWFALWLHTQWQQFVFWSPSSAHPTWYYLNFLPWFAWPAWPLALWTLSQGFRRKQMHSAGIALPLVLWACNTLILSFAIQPRADLGLPLLLPLAWLAAGDSATLRRGAANALYWFAIMTFGVLAAAVWLYWSALDLGYPAQLAHHLHALQPHYQGQFRPWLVVMALLYSVSWLALLSRLRRSAHRPLLAWAAGMTLSWGLVAFLFVYPIDQRLSYFDMTQSLAPHLPVNDCISSLNINASARAMLDYYLDVQTLGESHPNQFTCPAMLVEYPEDVITPVLPGWHLVWQGKREGNHVEHYALYRRMAYKKTARKLVR